MHASPSGRSTVCHRPAIIDQHPLADAPVAPPADLVTLRCNPLARVGARPVAETFSRIL